MKSSHKTIKLSNDMFLGLEIPIPSNKIIAHRIELQKKMGRICCSGLEKEIWEKIESIRIKLLK